MEIRNSFIDQWNHCVCSVCEKPLESRCNRGDVFEELDENKSLSLNNKTTRQCAKENREYEGSEYLEEAAGLKLRYGAGVRKRLKIVIMSKKIIHSNETPKSDSKLPTKK